MKTGMGLLMLRAYGARRWRPGAPAPRQTRPGRKRQACWVESGLRPRRGHPPMSLTLPDCAKFTVSRTGLAVHTELSFDEWAAKTTAKFATADRDGSGTLNPAEFATTAVKRSPARRRCPPQQLANESAEAE